MEQSNKFYKGNAFAGTVYYAPRKNMPQSLSGYTAVSKVLDAAGNRHTAETCSISQDGLSIDVVFNGKQTREFARGLAQWNIFFQFGEDTSTAFSTGVFQFEVTDNPSI